jgi:undecaprenyl-diphosphatase
MKEYTETKIIRDLQHLPGKYKSLTNKIMETISIPFHGKIYILVVLFLYLIKKISTSQIYILCSSQIISFIIKYIIKRKRPFETDKGIQLLEQMNFDKYSFPSGHTLNAYLLSDILKENIGVNLYFLPYIVGLSRVYLGVHYPTDVIGSILLSKIILHSL